MANSGYFCYSAATNIGKRPQNQDNLRAGNDVPFLDLEEYASYSGVVSLDSLQVFAVCDGIGGGIMGELAAITALQAIDNGLKKIESILLTDILVKLAQEAQNKVSQMYQQLHQKGGTTIVMLACCGNEYAVLNIGDSPAFLYSKDDKLKEVSCRHNLAAYKRKLGMTPSSIDEHTVMYYLGMDCFQVAEVADIHSGKLVEGDKFLLCSDGVMNEYSLEQLKTDLRNNISAKRITESAAEKQYADNCTAIILSYVDCKKEKR